MKVSSDTPIVVRVTVDSDDNMINIEALQERETGDLGGKAIPQLINTMLAKNTTDVDAISGASATSKAFKLAVSEVLKNAKNNK
ncbi:uncharacterized protein with FMN-binding domain [Lactobacillus colini]|uniref:Uncharacterized protein with FMN-binding domain n=1 Tax=Lactobacillus colini TaxID=1819254 RepID=A0ABS4MBZ2_9LACO|nr:FMN-binding protein [Lactobacillus colini]MBP2057205.1 uncharacterized protein with FMN-binding domain [Lactobacillus colini]